MYTFVIVALLALATVRVVDVLGANLPLADRYRSVLTFVGALGAVLALDYSLFDGFGTAVRDRDVGVWMTGFMVAGMTVPWRAAFTWLTHDRAMVDETLGHRMPIRKVA